MLNRKALNHAKSLISQGKVDRSSGWSFEASDGNAILGDPPNWDRYALWFLMKRPEANPETKEAYAYPYGKNGKVYRSALIAIRQRAAQQGEDEIFRAAGTLLAMIDKSESEMGETVETGWIEIFRAGEYPQGKFTEKDLDEIVSTYDPTWHEAPVVIGHPQTDAPAWGWVAGLKREGQSLFARFRQVAPEFAELVREGRYKKISAAFSKLLGKGKWYLKHVGFLGAVPPQVKGLAPVAFVEDKEDVVIEAEFAKKEDEMTKDILKELEEARAKLKELEAKEAKFAELQAEAEAAKKELQALQAEMRRKEIKHKIDGMVKDGKLAPAFVEAGIVEFMAALDDSQEITFSASGSDGTVKKTLSAWFEEFLQKAAELGLFAEIAKKERFNPKEDEEIALGLKIAGKRKEE